MHAWGERAGLRRTGEPNLSRETKFSGAKEDIKKYFSLFS